MEPKKLTSIPNRTGAIAGLVRHANGAVIPGQMNAADAAKTLMVAQLPLLAPYDPLAHKKSRSHVKPSSAARRAMKIKAGLLAVVGGHLVGA